MEDLILVENICVIKGYKLILCGNNPLVAKLEDWLEGSGLEVITVNEPEVISGLNKTENVWLFLPNDALDIWNDFIEAWQKQCEAKVRVSTLGALHYALTLIGIALFSDDKKYMIEEKIRKEQLDTVDGAFYYMSRVVLTDADVDEVKETNPVLALGAAKVGTTSIYDSLRAAGIPTRHLHSIIGEKIIETLKNLPKKVKIITGVREPLSRDLSFFFQIETSFDRYIYRGSFEDRLKNSVYNAHRSSKYLLNEDPSPYGLEFGWFDKEFKENFGLDIFEQPFDKEKGYTIYQYGNLEVFLYRLENLKSLEGELQDFLGRKDFKLLHTNNGAEKNISYIYKEVKAKYKFSKAQIQIYYDDNERMDYFYTKEEQEAFLKKLLH